MPLQHFFLHGAYCGQTNREKIRSGDRFVDPSGQAFFCPLCSELWLLAPVDGQATVVSNLACGRHQPGDRLGIWSTGSVSIFQPPGSVWRSWEPEWNNALPKKLLEYEFHLTLNYVEKYYEPETDEESHFNPILNP